MLRRAALLPLLPLLAASGSCAGTDVGNPTVTLDAALVREGSALGGTRVTEAWIQVERVRLRPASDCDGEAELDLEGPFALDLLAAGIPRALARLPVTTTRFCRFELRWAPAGDSGAGPAELSGASLFLAGERADGVPFVIRSERNDELRLDAVNGGFEIEPTGTGLFVGLDAVELFANVPLAAATPTAEGELRIEPGTNDELLAAFEEALQTTTRLFRDGNHDADLDDAEADPARALAE